MRRVESRLDRLEKRCRPQARQYELVVRYYGEPVPDVDDSWSLTLWLHQPWCNDPSHTGACGQRSPEED
jgi:hypothetical protein